jgi:hypothetical protein
MTTIDETTRDYAAEKAARALTLRAQRIAGIRAMCDWLEANPGTQLPNWDSVNVPLTTNAAVEAWADKHGVRDLIKYDSEGNASLNYMFGAVAMQVYGYADFAEHCNRAEERKMHEYATKHGLALVAAESDGAL